MNNRELGMLGENMAAHLMEKKGYTIIRRNYRCKAGEIDIIAVKAEELVFAEVKTRQSFAYGRPCEAVGKEKQKHIKQAASCYLRENGKTGKAKRLRFDVMEIIINHIEGAF